MTNIGYASIEVIPSFRGFGSKLNSGVGSQLGSAGTVGGTKYGDAAGKSAGSRFKAGFGSAVKTAMGAAAVLIGARAIGGLISSSIGEAREAQKVGAQTAAVIKSTGGVAKISADQVADLSNKLSLKTGIDDEAIQSGANLLLTFKNIHNEAGKGNKVFDQATQSVTDMSVALGQDMKSGSIQLGKALNDPIKGITALSRVGVTFSDSQKKQIEGFVKSGDAMKAQKVILKELESEFGGSAAAQATAADKAKVSWENLKEQIGGALLPVLDKLATFASEKLIPALSKFGSYLHDTLLPAVKTFGSNMKDELVPAFQAIGRFITGRVVPGFKALAGFVQRNSDLIAPLGAVLGGVGTALVIVAAATKAWAITQAALNLVMAANPITLVVLALGALAAGLVIAYKRSETFRDIVGSALDVVSAGVSAVSSAFSAMWTVVQPIITAFVTYIQQNWGGIVTYLGDVFGTLKDIVVVSLTTIASVIADKLSAAKAVFVKIVDGIQDAWGKFGGNITTVVQGAFQIVTGIIRGALQVIRGVVHTVLALVTGDWSGAWNGLKEIVAGVWTAIQTSVSGGLTIIKGLLGAAWTAIKLAASAAWASIRDDVSSKFDKIVDVIRGVPGKIAGLAGGFKDAGKAIIDGLISGISTATGFVTGIAGSIWNVLKGLINTAIDQINTALEFSIPVPGPLPDIPINAPNIPRLATGGIVNRPTLALIGESGPEAVVPLDRRSGRAPVAGGVNITVENMHVAGYSDMMSQLQHRVRGAALGGVA